VVSGNDEAFIISQADERPMYVQLMEQVRRRIAVGAWAAGQEISSIRALAAGAQVSVITVKRAYQELEREGLIVTRQGRGTFVSEHIDDTTTTRRHELDRLIGEVAELSRRAGISVDELMRRLRDARDRLDQPDHERGRTHD
jgi:GntR family transcriptional regulator